MTRLVTAGAESGSRQQADYSDSLDVTAGVVDYAANPELDPGSGSRYGYIGGTPAASGGIQFAHTNSDELFYRFRWRIDNATIGEEVPLCYLTDSNGLERYHFGNQNHDLAILTTATGEIKVYRDNGFATVLVTSAQDALFADTWHLIQIYLLVADVDGRLVVKVDGATFIDFTGDTKGTQNTTGGESIIVFAGSSNRDVFVDDIAINDTTGTLNNDYPLDTGIVGFFVEAMGTGTNNLNGTTEATDRYLNIDERPPSDSDYNSDNVVGQYDLYQLEDTTAVSIQAVEIWARTHYPATASTFKFVYKIGGVEYRSAALAPTFYVTYPPVNGVDGPWYRHFPLDAVPGSGAAWTRPDLNDLEIGFEVATAEEMRVTHLFVEAEGAESDPCVLLPSDGLLLVDASDGDVTVSLEPGQVTGQVFYIKRIDDSANTVTLDPYPLTIDGLDSITLSPLDAVTLVTNNIEWFRL